jgi:hypothetical protein
MKTTTRTSIEEIEYHLLQEINISEEVEKSVEEVGGADISNDYFADLCFYGRVSILIYKEEDKLILKTESCYLLISDISTSTANKFEVGDILITSNDESIIKKIDKEIFEKNFISNLSNSWDGEKERLGFFEGDGLIKIPLEDFGENITKEEFEKKVIEKIANLEAIKKQEDKNE